MPAINDLMPPLEAYLTHGTIVIGGQSTAWLVVEGALLILVPSAATTRATATTTSRSTSVVSTTVALREVMSPFVDRTSYSILKVEPSLNAKERGIELRD